MAVGRDTAYRCANRRPQARGRLGQDLVYPDMGIGKVTWQGARKTNPANPYESYPANTTTCSRESSGYLAVASAAGAGGIAQRLECHSDGSTTLTTVDLDAVRRQGQLGHMRQWLEERKALGKEINAFGKTRTYLERTPHAYCTPADESVLAQLKQEEEEKAKRLKLHADRNSRLLVQRKVEESKDRVADADHGKRTMTNLLAFASSLQEPESKVHRTVTEPRRAPAIEVILKSMEAMNGVLRRNGRRLQAALKHLDVKKTGKLRRPVLEAVFRRRAFEIERELLKVFLDRLYPDDCQEVDYTRIVALEGVPWTDIPLSERWPGLLSDTSQRRACLSTARPAWGSSQSAVKISTSRPDLAVKKPKAPASDTDTEDGSSAETGAALAARNATLKAFCDSTLVIPTMAKQRKERVDQLQREYEAVLAWCRKNDVVLNEQLLKVLLVPPDDAPCLECVKAIQQPGAAASGLLLRKDIQARVDEYLKSIGLGEPEVERERERSCYDSRSNYSNGRPGPSTEYMRLSTGAKRIRAKVDCWMTLDQYERLTSGLRTRFRRRTTVGDTAETKGMQAFWPGYMLDCLRLWMPVIDSRGSAAFSEPIKNGGSSRTVKALFQCVHRQPSRPLLSNGAKTAGTLPPMAKTHWPVSSSGYIQHGSVDYSSKPCHL